MNIENTLAIVDDNPADCTRYIRMLEDEDNEFSDYIKINTLTQAIDYLKQSAPDCCILDYNFPSGSAKALLEELKEFYKEEIPFPVIVSTGQGDEKLAVELMRMGVQDYLVKDDISSSDLSRAINNAVRTFNLQKQLHHMAHYDALTGLLNRTLFMDRLKQAFNEAKRYGHDLSLLYLDIDHFKIVNDTYGHDSGDAILKCVADRILDCVRETDSVGRLGGDEFVILLPETSSDNAIKVAEKLLTHIPYPVVLDTNTLNISPSIGLASYPGFANDHTDLLKQADTALYQAKNHGRSQLSIYSDENMRKFQNRFYLQKALPEALNSGEVQLAYQPLYRSHDGKCCNVEALVRWKHMDEWVSPPQIIEMISHGTLAVQFHQWLFNESLTQLNVWQKHDEELNVSINLPANLCHDRIIESSLFNAIDELHINPERINIEVTETHMMTHPDTTRKVLDELTRNGIKIAIDDFGTGFSSMEYLADLPCDKLKIDQRFFLDYHSNDKNLKIIEAITALGHSLDLEVIAEGIETQEIADLANQVGCDCHQGYWYGKPAFAEPHWPSFLSKSRALPHPVN